MGKHNIFYHRKEQKEISLLRKWSTSILIETIVIQNWKSQGKNDKRNYQQSFAVQSLKAEMRILQGYINHAEEIVFIRPEGIFTA